MFNPRSRANLGRKASGLGRKPIQPALFLGCKMGSKKTSSRSSASRRSEKLPLASVVATLRANLINMTVTIATSAIVYYGLVVAQKLI